MNPILAFFVGVIISAIAAIPPILLLSSAGSGHFHVKMRAWAIGLAIRFLIIGAALLILFRLTDAPQVPVILGVVTAYFAIFALELVYVFRSRNPK